MHIFYTTSSLSLVISATISVSLAAPARFSTSTLQSTRSRTIGSQPDSRPREESVFNTVFWPYDPTDQLASVGELPPPSDVFMLMASSDLLSASPITTVSSGQISSFPSQTLVQDPLTRSSIAPNLAALSTQPSPSNSATAYGNEVYTHAHKLSVVAAIIGSLVGIIICVTVCKILVCGLCGPRNIERENEECAAERGKALGKALVCYDPGENKEKVTEMRVLDIRKGFPFSRFSESSSEASSSPSISDISLFSIDKFRRISALKQGSRISTTRRPLSHLPTLSSDDFYYSLPPTSSTNTATTCHKHKYNRRHEGKLKKPRVRSKSSPVFTLKAHTQPQSRKSMAESNWNIVQGYSAPRWEQGRSVDAASTVVNKNSIDEREEGA
jgi:hypothetical protein